MIDLRSDTVTLPSEKMKQFILNAPLGDDVYREDPTINSLEQQIAEISRGIKAMAKPGGILGSPCTPPCLLRMTQPSKYRRAGCP